MSKSASGDENIDTQGMGYLDKLPRRAVVVYLPLAVFTFVLLFPFYWMAIAAPSPSAPPEMPRWKDSVAIR